MKRITTPTPEALREKKKSMSSPNKNTLQNILNFSRSLEIKETKTGWQTEMVLN